MGRPTSNPKISSCCGAVINPNYLPHPHPWTQPTHHPKRHPDQSAVFPQYIRQPDRVKDRQIDRWHNAHATKPVPIPAYAVYDDAMQLIM